MSFPFTRNKSNKFSSVCIIQAVARRSFSRNSSPFFPPDVVAFFDGWRNNSIQVDVPIMAGNIKLRRLIVTTCPSKALTYNTLYVMWYFFIFIYINNTWKCRVFCCSCLRPVRNVCYKAGVKDWHYDAVFVFWYLNSNTVFILDCRSSWKRYHIKAKAQPFKNKIDLRVFRVRVKLKFNVLCLRKLFFLLCRLSCVTLKVNEMITSPSTATQNA